MSAPSKLTLPMPRLGETMEEGTIAEWLVQPGQSFQRGDPLLEVETDKTLVEYPALGDGTLLEALVTAGDVVAVGTPIAVIETADAWEGVDTPARPEPAPIPETAPLSMPMPMPPIETLQARDTGDQTRPRATPLARRMAKQNGIAIDQIDGTGRRGRIEAEDVQALISPEPRKAGSVRIAEDVHAPVYCVHGFAGLGSNWAVLRAHLQREGILSVAPDLPGHGRNPVDAFDVETLVDWLAQDLQAQTDPVHVVGHSLGAYVAVQAVLRDPSQVSQVTLITPAGCGRSIMGAFVSGMASAPGAGELSHLMRLLGPKAAQLDSQALAAMAQGLHGKRLTALAQSMACGDTQRIDTIGALQSLAGQVPLRAVFGLADQIIPKEHLFHIPSHVACHMIDAGHMPHWDATEEVASIIAAQ
ncbi:MAG: acetoin dehydrogenase dihydrolipoyllysine-residue acetyltransferase subunit [Roseobacter sp.]